MVLEFTNLGMRIMGVIGVPMFFIMGPVNCFFGGHAAKMDHLSYFSFGNISDGSSLYWIQAFVVWGVVFLVQSSLHKAQRNFLPLRFQWLRDLPNNRANTILIEGIPEAYQSDEALKLFFNKMFGGDDKIQSAYVVRKASELEAAWNSREAKKQTLQKARYKANKVNAVDADKEAAVALQDELAELDKEVAAQQLIVKSKGSILGPDGFHTASGFVTFSTRSDAALSLELQLGQDADDWQISLR